MRITIAVAAALAATALAGPAAAAPPAQAQPSPSTSSLLAPPVAVPRGLVPAPGQGSLTAGSLKPAAAGSCGACLTTCWSATSWSGPSDWSGSVHIYQHISWCGNGAQVTYATVSQSYSQSGSYRLDSAYGPWWSGGCIGCATLRASGYILWSWSPPLISIPQSGTSHLDTTVYAYGNATT
ncbi:MAG TPA: hypothetical protein VFA24_05535 [Gaiellaceae bacterium]|nr:hypothetical protein [Gaiellaceae bacterium]